MRLRHPFCLCMDTVRKWASKKSAHTHINSMFLCITFSTKMNLKDFPKKVQVGKDQEKAQSEKDSHSKNRGGKKPN